MTFDLDLDMGIFLVKHARRVLVASFKNEKINNIESPDKVKEYCGVFVTLNKLIDGKKSLRGCIGYPYPIKPLVEAVTDVAYAAAFEDPRFPKLKEKELNDVVIEVSVLTPPEKIEVKKPEEYPTKVKIGEDGLIIKRGARSGLLLPQVATEWGWDAEEFLSQCCIKAGLTPDSWLLPGTDVQCYKAIIFSETSPDGTVVKEELHT